jgi:hypothetical protein
LCLQPFVVVQRANAARHGYRLPNSTPDSLQCVCKGYKLNLGSLVKFAPCGFGELGEQEVSLQSHFDLHLDFVVVLVAGRLVTSLLKVKSVIFIVSLFGLKPSSAELP